MTNPTDVAMPPLPEPEFFGTSRFGTIFRGHRDEVVTDYAKAYAAPLVARVAELQALSERLKMEAQVHAQEARTANATIAEIYQLVTGKTGEPGNWNGAEPVRARLAELEADAARYRWLRDGELPGKYPYPVMRTGIGEDDFTLWDDELDAAIDAALTSNKEQQP